MISQKNCSHRRKKKIYNHGKKGKAEIIVCKDCGEILKRNEIAKQHQNKIWVRKKK
jgi:hypothetical protein